MRIGLFLLSLMLLVSAASAQSRSPAFLFAEDVYNSRYDAQQRVTAQVMLMAAGYQNWVPTETFLPKSFDAVRTFQSNNGMPATGALDRATYDRLTAVTAPLFRMWNFQEIAHPVRGPPIWMPQGMSLIEYSEKNNVGFRDAQDRFQVGYNFYPRQSAQRMFDWLLDDMRAHDTVVHFNTMKDGWFVISATTKDGSDKYLRYHQDGDGVVGFTARWSNDKGVVYGDRIAVLMSASLGSKFNGRPFMKPPSPQYGPMAERPVMIPQPTPLVVPVPVPAPPIAKVEPAPQVAPIPQQPNMTQQFYFNFSTPEKAVPQTRDKVEPQEAILRSKAPPSEPKRYDGSAPEQRVETPPPGSKAPASPRIDPPPGIKPEVIPAPVPTLREEKRVALVIGNSTYRYAPEILNPANDSQDAANALRKLGFEVIEGQDLDYQSIRDAVRKFSDEIKDADMTLFYYAGHGVQVSGKNYLVPIDAQLQNAGNLDIDTINLETILRAMQTEPRTNIVILDACRDNPFTRSLKRSLSASRAVSVGTGLAPIDTQGGTLVVFATDPGNVALDGTGTRNSPFTQALLKHLSTPELEVETLMKRVRRDVVEGTNGKQTPWTNSSLMREVYLVRARH